MTALHARKPKRSIGESRGLFASDSGFCQNDGSGKAGVDLVKGDGYLLSSNSFLIWQEISMTTFDSRKDGFEKKHAHDEELQFKATARRNKLLGNWAAEKLGLTGDEATQYAKDVVASDFEEAGDDDVVRKVLADFKAKNVDQSEHQVRRTMDELMGEAIAQVKAQ
jgi:hypothetical protein